MRDRESGNTLAKDSKHLVTFVPPVSRQTTLTRSIFRFIDPYSAWTAHFPLLSLFGFGITQYLLCTLDPEIKTNLPVSIPSSIQPVHPCHLAQATRSPPQKPQQESFSRGGVREVCERVLVCACVCKSCGAFVLGVKHWVRIHFLSVCFSLFLFFLSFPSYRIIYIAISITIHRHLFVLHGFKERFDSAPSLSYQAYSAPPPLSTHPPWSPQSFDRSASPSPWLSYPHSPS